MFIFYLFCCCCCLVKPICSRLVPRGSLRRYELIRQGVKVRTYSSYDSSLFTSSSWISSSFLTSLFRHYFLKWRPLRTMNASPDFPSLSNFSEMDLQVFTSVLLWYLQPTNEPRSFSEQASEVPKLFVTQTKELHLFLSPLSGFIRMLLLFEFFPFDASIL